MLKVLSAPPANQSTWVLFAQGLSMIISEMKSAFRCNKCSILGSVCALELKAHTLFFYAPA